MKQPRYATRPMAGTDMKLKDIIARNFFGGMAWGLGSVLGATVVVALLLSVLRTVNYIPAIGNFVDEVSRYTERNR